MSDLVSLEGAIVLRKGKLTLRIPLAAGGDKLAPSAKGIGKIEGEFLNVIIQPWLAQKLCIGAGDMVMVDNREGTFNITRSSSHPSALSTRRVGTSLPQTNPSARWVGPGATASGKEWAAGNQREDEFAVPCPFPGMDPYLEDASLWLTFHQTLINGVMEALTSVLTSTYQLRIGERYYDAGGERCEEYVEIINNGDSRLVTLIDVVSPTNKTTAVGREAYLSTRRQAKGARANVVEIDLVLQGRPTLDYSRDGLPHWDYAITVTRAPKPERYEIYTSTLQKSLPRFRLPLESTDRDAVLDLQSIFGRCYDRVGFGSHIDYDRVPAALHDWIAIAAYQLWQQEGCPQGRDREHWYEAVAHLKRPTAAI